MIKFTFLVKLLLRLVEVRLLTQIMRADKIDCNLYYLELVTEKPLGE
jgi:hypothetical protein